MVLSNRQRAVDVVVAISRAGFTISLMPVCVQLRVRGPKPGLSTTLRAQLVELRVEVIDLIITYGCTGCGRFAFVHASALCYWCRAGRASV